MIAKAKQPRVWSPTPCAAEIGARLQGLRRGRRLSVADVHRLSGVAYGSLHDYESGRRVPCTENIIRLASLFEVSCDVLLFGWPRSKWEKLLKRIADPDRTG